MRAHVLREVDVGADLLHDFLRDRRDVDGGRDHAALEAEHDVLGDLLAGAVLRFGRGRAEVRREDDVVELDERRVGARLDLEDVDAGAGDLAGADRVGERGHLVDAAAGGVDQAHAVLHLRELLGAEHADRVLGLGQVHGDEVGERQQLVDRLVEGDAHLGGALLGGVGVVADELHAEAAGALGDERADAAQADDGERLLVELGAGELGALPLAAVHDWRWPAASCARRRA